MASETGLSLQLLTALESIKREKNGSVSPDK